MSVSQLFLLLLFGSRSIAVAEPCPECEEMMAPAILEIPSSPPPVVVTEIEKCCECGECEEMSSASQTITTSVCGNQRAGSIMPYTSGTSTFYISSCVPTTLWQTPAPSTMWYSLNATTVYTNITQPAESCSPASTVYANVTLPASTSIMTTISTVFENRNGTSPPTQTITQTNFIPTRIVSIEDITYSGTTTLSITTTYSMTVTTTVVQTSYETTISISSVPGQTATQTTTMLSSVPPATLISSAPGNTIVSTEDVTFTTQLQAATITSTIQGSIETVYSTIPPSTETIFTTIPASTEFITSTLPQQTQFITNTESGAVQSITATIGDSTVTETTSEIGSTVYDTISQTLTSTLTATMTTSYYSTVFTTITVTTSILATTQTRTATATATATATSNRVSTGTVTFTPLAQTITATTRITTSVTTTRISTVTTSAAPAPAGYGSTCIADAPDFQSTCVLPGSNYRITLLNFGGLYLTSTSGGATANSDHETLTFTTSSAQGLLFGSSSTGQATIIRSGGATLLSDQDSTDGGNEPIYFDSTGNTQAPTYGGGSATSQPVQFCLQSDNTISVQNPSNGATNVMMCDNILYLFTTDNGNGNGCTPVTLVKS